MRMGRRNCSRRVTMLAKQKRPCSQYTAMTSDGEALQTKTQTMYMVASAEKESSVPLVFVRGYFDGCPSTLLLGLLRRRKDSL